MSIVVHNPTETPVRDYPIQNPATNEVQLWSINPGETLEFPDFAGKYLLDIYQFLQRIVTSKQLQAEREAEARLAKGQQFDQIKVVDKGFTNEMMQPPVSTSLAPSDPELTPADQQMSGAIEGDAVSQAVGATPDLPASLTPKPAKKGAVVCPDCSQEFQNVGALKTHYAFNHVTIPGVN